MLFQHNTKHADKLEENCHQKSVIIRERLGPFSGHGERAIALASIRYGQKHSHLISTSLMQIARRVIRNQDDSYAAEYFDS